MWALLGISSCGPAVLALQTVAQLECFCGADPEVLCFLRTHLEVSLVVCKIIWGTGKHLKWTGKENCSGFHSGRKLYWHRGRWLNKVVGSEKMQSAVFSSEWRLFDGSCIHVEIKKNTGMINYWSSLPLFFKNEKPGAVIWAQMLSNSFAACLLH